jgi:hypothetical protein
MKRDIKQMTGLVWLSKGTSVGPSHSKEPSGSISCGQFPHHVQDY